MNGAELESFFEKNSRIEWFDDVDNELMVFRNLDLLAFQKERTAGVAVSYTDLHKVATEQQLLDVISCGYHVEQMARVTGYYSKVGSWNKGKVGELKERRRHAV
ncbi:MAG: hypothetical protein GY868_01945 [Deltaproteobacteria bacterium]|nr:hypothetical protein [Deltaproteobacteria bacterium]